MSVKDNDDNFDPAFEHGSVVAVTPVLAAGTQTIGVDCNQGGIGAINFVDADIVAVALSAA